MKLTRRLFLRNSAVVPAVALAASAPTANASAAKSRVDLVLWHMSELERLTKEAGAPRAAVLVAAHGVSDAMPGGPGRSRTLLIDHTGDFDDRNLAFWEDRT